MGRNWNTWIVLEGMWNGVGDVEYSLLLKKVRNPEMPLLGIYLVTSGVSKATPGLMICQEDSGAQHILGLTGWMHRTTAWKNTEQNQQREKARGGKARENQGQASKLLSQWSHTKVTHVENTCQMLPTREIH